MKVIITTVEKLKIIEYLRTGSSTLNGMSEQERKNFLKKAKNYVFTDECLFFVDEEENFKVVVADDDNEKLKEIFDQMHLPDHTGMKAMYLNSKSRYIGFKRERINSYVTNCLICNRHRPLRRIAPIIPIVAQFPWQLVQMDCIDVRNYSDVNDGYGWILNILDCYSKFLFPVPMKQKSADSVKEALEKCTRKEGYPKVVQTDNGREFNNMLLSTFLNETNTEFRRGRPRHPQNQGQVERANQTLMRKIAKCLSDKVEKRWIDVIDEITFKYNTSWHRAINMTPMEAFRGRTGINLPAPAPEENYNDNIVEDDIDDIEVEFIGNLDYVEEENIGDSIIEITSNQEDSRRTVDEEYRVRYISRMQQDADVHYHSIQFNPGDKVLLKQDFDMNTTTRRRKMDDFYEEGTWEIRERVGSDSFRIQKCDLTESIRVVCKNRLKKINSI